MNTLQKKSAVIDRFVDQAIAVLLVGPEEIEEHVPIERLPADAEEGTWLIIDEHGTILLDPDQTERVESIITDKLAMLRQRSQKSQFKK